MDSSAPREESTMASNVIKVNGVEVTSDCSKPTVININVSQPPATSCFLESLKYLGKGLKPLGDRLRSHGRTGGASSVSLITEVKHGIEGARIVIAVASISLGVILCLVHESMTFEKGVAFWTGFPFLLSGILSLVKEKTSSCFWRWAARFMSFASFVVAIAGVAVIADDLRWYFSYDWSPSRLCEPERQYGSYGRYYPTASYQDIYRQQRCNDITQRLLSLFDGVRVLLLLATIAGLITCICSVACDWWARLCKPCLRQEEEENLQDSDVEPLLPSLLPPAYEEKQLQPNVQSV
ncbi:transmembrane protein 176B-like [Pleurodeles waltl]|uniref:transmembrane protein 176B-like n=1 Tax=Pleurodeles waltl TaxID=8319 RepID=UPI0037094950